VLNFRSSLIIIVDATTSVLALWLGVSIKNESWFIVPFSALPLFILAAIALVFFFWLFGIYAEINKQLQVRQILQISKALALYALVFAALCILLYPTGVPRTVGVMQPILALVGVVGVRVLRSTWYEYVESRVDSSVKKTKVFIYGAGSAGRLLSSSLKHTQFFVEAFLDDDEKKIGRTLEGYLVRDGKGLDPAEKTNISTILLAMPTLTGEQRSNLFDRLDSLGYRMVTVPRLVDLASGAKPIADIRPLALEDLLEREPVKPNPMLLEKNVKGLCVLVTGAGGSIGSELCRQIIRLKPSSLVLVDHSEFMLFQIDQELRQMMLAKSDEKPPVEIFSALASTSDSGEMDAIFSKHPVSTVFHAAAYKHVHLLEENIRQGMRNNIVGTMEVIRCSEKYRVDNVVLVSTDKAVRPSSVMGLSKRVAELVIQNAAALSSHALYSIVRFGNVLGSNGSVIPIFRDQISKGGPVTVTDPEVTRYFMTIPEAASLVIQASALAKGGDVFVLEMGEPVKIVSVAERLVKLAGYTPTYGRPETQDQIEIQFVGLKAGEKMHEELTLTDERYPTLHPKVFRVEEPTVASETLERALNPLLVETDYNAEQLKARMLSLVSDVAFVE
jgi:FlaA1/EpsC-like NDP-sugar epimerase